MVPCNPLVTWCACPGSALNQLVTLSHMPRISSAASRVTVRVIRTDEERMIVRSVTRLLHLGKSNPV